VVPNEQSVRLLGLEPQAAEGVAAQGAGRPRLAINQLTTPSKQARLVQCVSALQADVGRTKERLAAHRALYFVAEEAPHGAADAAGGAVQTSPVPPEEAAHGELDAARGDVGRLRVEWVLQLEPPVIARRATGHAI